MSLHGTDRDRLEHIQELEARLRTAEEALRAAQSAAIDAAAPFRSLVQEMSEGALVLSPDHRIVYANRHFAAMLGLPEQRLTGSSLHQFIVADDARALQALLTRGRQSAVQAELRLKGTGGKTVPASLSVTMPHPGMEAICVLVKDLTEHKERQRTLAAENLARSILEEAAASIVLVDLDGKIIRANRAAERIVNQSLLMRHFDDVFHVRGPMDWSYARILSVVKSVQIEGLDLTAVQSDGQTADLLLSAVPLCDDESQLLGCLITLTDITERRRAEQALLRSKERLDMAHQAAGAGTWDRDITTRRLDWSPELFRLFGLDPLDTAASMELFYSVMHDDDREAARARIQQAVRDRKELSVEYRVVLPDGRVRWISALGRGIYDAAGNPIGTTGICIDITTRKLAEQEIQQSRAQLEAAFQAMQGGVMVFEMDGRAILVNGSMARIAGFPDAGAMKQKLEFFLTHFELMQPDGTPVPPEEWPASKVLRGETLSDYHLRARRLDTGEESYFSFSGAPVYDRDGRQTLAVVVTRDITKRMLLEEEVRRRAEEVQKVMEVAPVAIWVAHDPLCRIITGNRAANLLFEIDGDSNVLPGPVPGDPNAPFRFFRNGQELKVEEFPMQVAATRGEDVREAELEVELSSGKRLALWGHASPLLDAAGEVRGCVGAFLDITPARQRAEAALRESEERFQTMADMAPIMIWVTGADGACQFVNKAWMSFTGLAPEGALGFSWTDCVHPDDRENYLRVRSAAFHEHCGYQAEYRLRRADGEYRWVISHTTPRYGVNGVFAGSVGSCMDITDVKKAQEEDLGRQKLESIGTLAGGIAHDFNNLLGSVLATTELALAEVDDGQSPAECLQRIRDVAIRGAEIVRQLMIYSGQESAVSEFVDVSRVVEEMVELLKISTGRHVTLKTSMGSGLPAVMANPAQIRQVVMNLVINASEAIGEHPGVIEVSTSQAKVAPDGLSIGSERLSEGDYVRLSVSDTGRGMTPAEQARVFDPFFTTKAAGHGLGLAVVQGIVRALGGAIRLASGPRGTTFEIFLPCAGKPVQDAPVPPTAVAAAPEHIPANSAVLVIEDEDTLRTTVSMLLLKAGLQVMQARDGLAGLELLHRHPRDIVVILLDVTLPGMTSQEVLRQVRELRPDLRVILTSAYSEETVASWFAGLTFDGFIRKPYRLAELTAILR